VQERAAVGIAHGLGDPAQVVVGHRQHVGLLVVQVLDAVLDAAQELVGRGQRIGGFLRHEVGARQALQRVQRGPRAQFGELAAAHHLQQLHGELDLADAAARQLHVVGALGAAGAAARRLLADLPVQHAQRIEHAVVEVAAEHEGQHHAAQALGLAVRARCRAARPRGSSSRRSAPIRGPAPGSIPPARPARPRLGPELPLGRSARSTRNTKPCSVVSPTSA
jgi:hypothetical protein